MLFRQFVSKRSVAVLVLPAIVALVASRGLAAQSNGDAAAPSAKQGSEIFQTRCIVCHNKKPGDNTPFGPPNLYTVFGPPHPLLTPQQAETIVTHGRGQMPSFGPILSRTEIRSVIAYLRKRAAIAAPKKQ